VWRALRDGENLKRQSFTVSEKQGHMEFFDAACYDVTMNDVNPSMSDALVVNRSCEPLNILCMYVTGAGRWTVISLEL